MIRKIGKKILQKTPVPLDNFIFKKQMRKYREFPRSLNIEVTNKCNARCVMCPRGKGMMKRSIGTMDMILYKKIIDECSRFDVKKILLHLDGEPLLDMELEDKIRYAKEKTKAEIGFSSNAALFTKERAEKILKTEPGHILLSIDSVKKETYEKIRGISHEATMRGVENLLEAKQKTGSKTKLIVLMVKTEINHKEEKEFKKYWEGKDVIVSIKNAHNFLDADLRVDKKERRIIPCGKLWRTMAIFWNGDVPLCCRDYNGEATLGNLNQDTIQGIWKGEKMNQVRDIHLSRDKVLQFNPCNRCNEITRNIIPWA